MSKETSKSVANLYPCLTMLIQVNSIPVNINIMFMWVLTEVEKFYGQVDTLLQYTKR